MSLTYNRTLFTQAGLDPDKPPTTWDEVRAAAKTIAEKTGVAGYAEMATENTGGWQLTTSTYALGGRMETVGADGKVTATLNNPRPRRPSSASRRCAGTTTRMGSTFDYAWGTINQAFAAGQVGMFTGGSDLYTAMVQNNSLKPDDYGVTVIPLDGIRRRRPRRRHPRRGQRRHHGRPARRGGQVDRLLLHAEAADPGRRRRRRARRSRPTTSRSACPALPIFDKATYDAVAGRGSRTTSTSPPPR